MSTVGLAGLAVSSFHYPALGECNMNIDVLPDRSPEPPTDGRLSAARKDL